MSGRSEASRWCPRANAPGSPSKVKPTSCRYISAKAFSKLRLTGNLPVSLCSTRMTANCRQLRCRFSLRRHEGTRTISLLLEFGVHRIAARLLDHGDHQSPGPTHGGLARAALRRVDDMITAALDDTTTPSPTLDQLASAACLSVNHFIRAFRQQTGVTPHRHIVLRRIRARDSDAEEAGEVRCRGG